VDLSILGLLLGTRHLALTGASADVLRPAHRLLTFASVVTLALNVADPLVAGEAAFDAVGPLLLIGWAEVGPGFLQAIGAIHPLEADAVVGSVAAVERQSVEAKALVDTPARSEGERKDLSPSKLDQRASRGRPLEVLLEQARQEDAAHRATHQKPISADTLRVRLGIGATPARRLVRIVRTEFEANGAPDQGDGSTRVRSRTPATLAA
jgi:hypothetical protein